VRSRRSEQKRPSRAAKPDAYAHEGTLACRPERNKEGDSESAELTVHRRTRHREENWKRWQDDQRDHCRPPAPDGETEDERCEVQEPLAKAEVAHVDDRSERGKIGSSGK
jgi:hypothetical protein